MIFKLVNVYKEVCKYLSICEPSEYSGQSSQSWLINIAASNYDFIMLI